MPICWCRADQHRMELNQGDILIDKIPLELGSCFLDWWAERKKSNPMPFRKLLTERTSSLSLSEESGINCCWYDRLCLTCWIAISVARAVEQELARSVTVTVLWFRLGGGGWWWWWVDVGWLLLLPAMWLLFGTELPLLGLLGFALAADVAGAVAAAGLANARCPTSCCFTQFPTLSEAEFCTTFCIFNKVSNWRIHGPNGRLWSPASFLN
jgi:hypothetical protein